MINSYLTRSKKILQWLVIVNIEIWYFLAQSLLATKCSATDDLVAAFEVAIVIILDSSFINLNTHLSKYSLFLVFYRLKVSSFVVFSKNYLAFVFRYLLQVSDKKIVKCI